MKILLCLCIISAITALIGYRWQSAKYWNTWRDVIGNICNWISAWTCLAAIVWFLGGVIYYIKEAL